MSDYSLIINGKRVPGALKMPVINPATEQSIADCPRADEKQLNEAVAAAKAAFPAWSRKSWAERRAVLTKIVDAFEKRADEFAKLVTLEQGKPLMEAGFETMGSTMMMRDLLKLDLPEKILKEDATVKIVEHRTPLGVVAMIIPWNVPIGLITVKLIPALLAGNTAVAKPAPTTPLATLKFVELCNEFLPPGVFNVIVDANDLGDKLTSHPDVRKISFTGSTATGRKVAQAAGAGLKRVTLELGGNDAAIVLDDCDPKDVAPKLFMAAMINCGQICLAAKRIYVPEKIYDAVCAELANLANHAVVGDGMKEGTQIGPLQNKMQYEKVKAYLEDAKKNGRVIAGGEVPAGPGYFVRPTIVRDLPDNAKIVCEEQFGPIMPVLKYSTIDEVIDRANATDYGLGATIWTKNLERGLEVARRIQSGVVWVNTHMMFDPVATSTPAKQSGLGAELGVEGIREFTQNHVIHIQK